MTKSIAETPIGELEANEIVSYLTRDSHASHDTVLNLLEQFPADQILFHITAHSILYNINTPMFFIKLKEETMEECANKIRIEERQKLHEEYLEKIKLLEEETENEKT